VPDGQAALDFLYRRPLYPLAPCPAVMRLDLHLPRKQGHDVLAERKRHPQFKGIPVVVFTSVVESREVQRCYELGAKAVLQKPLVLEEYFAAVRTVVEVGRANASSSQGGVS
jgi:chemotaxis family two-component system response regulator Rcp1